MGKIRKPQLRTVLLFSSWTAVVVVSCLTNVYFNHRDTLNKAAIEARTHLQLNLSYRQLIAKLGGVYAPVDKVVPNPYLTIPDRDIELSGGGKLTTLNPAYMTRLAFELVRKGSDTPVVSKLTSLKVTNPSNSPDPWERRALQSFEQGAREASEVTDIGGQPYLRLIRPFITESSCLKCHGHQGYREGDVRGGISIAVPLAPYYQTELSTRQVTIYSHLFFWLIGMAGLVAFVRSDRRRQQTLAESEWRFRTLAETAGDWIYWLSDEGKIVFSSPSCSELTGYGPRDFMSDADLINRIIHPADLDHWNAHLVEVNAADNAELELRIVTRDGKTRWISHVCNPIREGGAFLGRRVCNRDISAQKRAEEDVRKLVALVETSSDFIGIADLSGRITYVNGAARQLAGIGSDDDVGATTIMDYFPDDTHEMLRSVVLPRCMEQGIWRGELPMRNHSTGATFPVELTVFLIKEPAGGDASALSLICSDVSERHKLEAQLRQSQKMEAVGQLAGGIAHDFNNMLSAIMGYGHLVVMKMKGDDPLREHVQHILEASEKAAGLTRSLLTFSRSQLMKLKPVDLNEIIEKLDTFLRRIIGEDIQFTTSLHPSELMILADAGQIEQVLMNLATNARDAMAGGGRLTISTGILHADDLVPDAAGRPWPAALITVSDTGAGIDDEARQRIFEPFFTTKEPGKGSGLGLAMVYGIVTQHKGMITVQSRRGEGTTFIVHLPLLPDTSRSPEENTSEGSIPRGRHETILLAEDDGALRGLLEDILREFGYAVISAADGEEAVKEFRLHRDEIDLLLFDIVMPRMSGPEAYNEIRHLRPGIKVVFASGYAAETLEKKLELNRDWKIVAKPIQPPELLKILRETLHGEGAGKAEDKGKNPMLQ